MQLNVNVDTREFDRAFAEYMKYTKRTVSEAINQHAYWSTRNAVGATKAATAEEIERDLRKESRKYKGVPLAAILVNKRRKKENKRGLTGKKMEKEVEKLIRKTKGHRNFIRSGWIPAIKVLSTLVERKSGAKIPSKTDKTGRTYGGIKPAKQNLGVWKAVCSVWNSALGKVSSPRAIKYLEKGMEIGIQRETASMLKYINKKLDQVRNRTMA